MIKWQSLRPEISINKRDVVALLALVIVVFLLPRLISQLPLQVGDFPAAWNLHLREPIDQFQDWIIGHRANSPAFVYFFDPVSAAIDWCIRRVEGFLMWLPWPVLLALTFLLGQRAGGLRVALVCSASLMFMAVVGLWAESMQTLALMGVSVIISLVIGIPLGILSARYNKLDAALRPLLDAMQTMPAFVYLVPVLLFFGIARVPSVVATIVYALPPAIRLTNLGIRRVSPATVEAARSFGSTTMQTLLKVQLPLAMPTIMAGVNQTIMMALGIVVIAALIGAGGLGREVMISLQRLRVGEGLMAGLAIVFMAIILDRISYGFAQKDSGQVPALARGFHLLPNKWHRFAPACAIERGLDWIISGGYRISQRLTAGLSRLAGIGLDWADRPAAAVTVELFLQRHVYFIGSLALLAGLLAINVIMPFGPFPAGWQVDLTKPVDQAVAWMRDNLYQIGNLPLGTGPLSDMLVIYGINPLRNFLQSWLPWPLVILGVALLTYYVANLRLALLATVGMFLIGMLGMWQNSMDTLSQVIVAVLVTVVIALPLGVLSARSDAVEALLRPMLDLLQTIPPFVFLVPVIMLFNVGRVPGIIASVLYALPPGIRLINLGIRQVAPETIEAAHAFGSSSRQTLLKVQLPLALPSIMMGINQIVMMVLAMVIIAGLVGGGGLGLESVVGLAKNQTGRGIEAGLAIVILAMIMDRMTQAWVEKRQTYQSDK